MMNTYIAKKKDIKRQWFLINAEGQILGRLATRIAILLRGKHKPEYTPHIDSGDGVVVINAAKVKVTGNKLKEKEYDFYSGYASGRRVRTLEYMMSHDPTKVLRLAIKRMIPDTPLGRDMLKKLKVYSGAEHPHKAQQPQEIKFKSERSERIYGR